MNRPYIGPSESQSKATARNGHRSARLTARQVEILERMTRPGATASRVGEDLGISVQTVKNHLRVIYIALGVHSLAQAARAARRRPRTPVR